MNMLARKISRAKWAPKEYLAPSEIRADAIGGCLRTTGDRLSWWRCKDDEEDVAEVASYISPVPGGIGPMTVAMLFWNLVQLAENNK